MTQLKQQVQKYLNEKDTKLQCVEFVGTVKVIHQDGSVFLLENASMENKEFGNSKLLLIWTEHCDNFFFFTDDLKSWHYTSYEVQEIKKRPESGRGFQECSDDY